MDLNFLYTQLENNALGYESPCQIGKLFQEIRDLSYKKNKMDVAEKAQWEVDFFNFVLVDGEVKSKFTTSNEHGERDEYPNLDRFNENACTYLIDRLSSTSNPLLKARYSHIVWCSPNKHMDYAKLAVDSYLELLRFMKKKLKKHPRKILDYISEKQLLTLILLHTRQVIRGMKSNPK